VRENQTIVVENLAVKNMVKNPKLSQAISDVSWGEITRQLAYKCRWYGRNYIEIDRWFTSSTRCSNCGYIALENAVKCSRMGLSRLWDTP
ncbi:IS200/IS605 family accessory protein TnpB-related protein, partial [Microcystis sp. M162S2]|uniref:IS200/IS605 family accessory protein TnpB-related protein n=1 Tax=Microcystis sp. M162S2 TaxID=2771154 RepID=UPI002588D347